MRTPEPPNLHYGVGGLFVGIHILITAIFWWQLPPQIPLFYSLPYGSNQLASRTWVVLLPALSLFVWLSYYFLSKLPYNSVTFIQILKWLQITCLFLITTALIHIVLVVL